MWLGIPFEEHHKSWDDGKHQDCSALGIPNTRCFASFMAFSTWILKIEVVDEELWTYSPM